MTVAVSDDNDKEDHNSEPGIKNPRPSYSPRQDQPEHRQNDRHNRKARSDRSPKNVPIPSRGHDLNAAGTEKMVRIKSVSDIGRVPVPARRRNDGNRAKDPQSTVPERAPAKMLKR